MKRLLMTCLLLFPMTVHAQGYTVYDPNNEMQSIGSNNLFIPDIKNMGGLPSLHNAISKNPRIKTLLEESQSHMDNPDDFLLLTEEIMDEWGNTGPLQDKIIPHGNFIANLHKAPMNMTECDNICQVYAKSIWENQLRSVSGMLFTANNGININDLANDLDNTIDALGNQEEYIQNFILWAIKTIKPTIANDIFSRNNDDILAMQANGVSFKNGIAKKQFDPLGTTWFWNPNHSLKMTYNTTNEDFIKNTSNRDSLYINATYKETKFIKIKGGIFIISKKHILISQTDGMLNTIHFTDQTINIKQKTEEFSNNSFEFFLINIISKMIAFFS